MMIWLISTGSPPRRLTPSRRPAESLLALTEPPDFLVANRSWWSMDTGRTGSTAVCHSGDDDVDTSAAFFFPPTTHTHSGRHATKKETGKIEANKEQKNSTNHRNQCEHPRVMSTRQTTD